MIFDRKLAFDNISRSLAITRYDIEHHQANGEYSLNIHGESYFMDILNYTYGLELENDNSQSMNQEFIDLSDKKNKIAYQVTTTRTSDKIRKTLKSKLIDKYKGYEIRILYLLEKSKPTSVTVSKINQEFNVDCKKMLFDSNDLIKDIYALESNKIIELNSKYFDLLQRKYTKEIVFNLSINHLLKESEKINKNYDDEFVTIETSKKIIVNNINTRVSTFINTGMDYHGIINGLETSVLEKLKLLIVSKWYKDILVSYLLKKVKKVDIDGCSVSDLQKVAFRNEINFNKLIFDLNEKIQSNIEVNDFNATIFSWVVISFFFEICDIGVVAKC